MSIGVLVFEEVMLLVLLASTGLDHNFLLRTAERNFSKLQAPTVNQAQLPGPNSSLTLSLSSKFLKLHVWTVPHQTLDSIQNIAGKKQGPQLMLTLELKITRPSVCPTLWCPHQTPGYLDLCCLHGGQIWTK